MHMSQDSRVYPYQISCIHNAPVEWHESSGSLVAHTKATGSGLVIGKANNRQAGPLYL